MSEPLTLDLPEDLARQARALAEVTNRRIEDVVIDSVARAVAEPIVEALPNSQLLALCDSTFSAQDESDLSRLLAAHKEGTLGAADRVSLDTLLAAYRRGLVLKARAWKEAVSRGLRTPLTDDAA